jgi:pilus assembly protein CpaB
MRAKSMALLMLALGCGLVASIGITQVMAKRNAEPAPVGDTQSIFIAVKDIPLGDRLSAECVKLEAWPKDKVPLGAVSKIEDIDGSRVRTKLYAGEPILEKKLLGKGMNMQGDSALIPKGYRVVPVKVDNASGGPGLIMPGDRVDVLVHLVRNTNNDVLETSTRTILQDIKVFAINDVVEVGEKDSKEKEKMNAKTISLLVTPAQGAKLMLASEMGKVQLFMRSPEDDSTAIDGISIPGDLFGDSKKAVRDKEKIYVDDTPPEPKKSTALADFLKNMKNISTAKAVQSVPSVTNDMWTMRILQPNGINELVLQADTGPQAAKMPNGSWHLISTSLTSASSGVTNGNNNKTQSTPQPSSPPAEPPVQQPDSPAAGAASEPTTTPPQGNDPSNPEPVADPQQNPSGGTNMSTRD